MIQKAGWEPNPRILLACPVYNHNTGRLFQWIEHIRRFNYDRYDIYLVDNTEDGGEFASHLNSLPGISCDHYRRLSGQDQVLTDCHNMIRRKVLDEGYDYFFSLEWDVFPERVDIIQHLLAFGKPVVGNTYFSVTSQGEIFVIMQKLKNYYLLSDEPEPKRVFLTRCPVPESFSRFDGKLKKQFAFGLGCCMIHWDVLQQIEFRNPVSWHRNPYVCDDTWFYIDCLEKSIPCYLDFSRIVTHKKLS